MFEVNLNQVLYLYLKRHHDPCKLFEVLEKKRVL